MKKVKYNDILFSSPVFVEIFINMFNDILETRGSVRIPDLYDCLGRPCTSKEFDESLGIVIPLHFDYGWTNEISFKNFKTTTYDWGIEYQLNLPKPKHIKDEA